MPSPLVTRGVRRGLDPNSLGPNDDPQRLARTQAEPVEPIAIDPETETVEGRIAGLIKRDAPVQQVSATKAKQQMQQRGLLSTSMALGEVAKAGIETSLPIAQQDVQASLATKQANREAEARRREFNVGFLQQRELSRQAGVQERQAIAAKAQEESRLMGERAVIDKEMLTASADEQLRLLVKRGDIDTSLQELKGTQAIGQIQTRGDIESGLVAQKGQIQLELQTADARNQARLIEQQGLINERLQLMRQESERELTILGGEVQKDLQTAQGNEKSRLLEQQAGIDARMASLRIQAEKDLTDQRGNIQQSLQTAQGEDRIRLLTKQNQLDTNMLNLRIKAESDLADKRIAAESRLQLERANISKQLITAEGQVKSDLLGQQADLDRLSAAQNFTYAKELQSQLGQINSDLAELNQRGDLANIEAQGQVSRDLTTLKAQLDTQLQELVGAQALERLGLESQSAMDLARLQGDYKILMQSSQSASTLFSNTQIALANVLANPDLSGENKQIATKNLLGALANGLAVIGSFGEMDLTSLLNFNTNTVGPNVTQAVMGPFPADTGNVPPVDYDIAGSPFVPGGGGTAPPPGVVTPPDRGGPRTGTRRAGGFDETGGPVMPALPIMGPGGIPIPPGGFTPGGYPGSGVAIPPVSGGPVMPTLPIPIKGDYISPIRPVTGQPVAAPGGGFAVGAPTTGLPADEIRRLIEMQYARNKGDQIAPPASPLSYR